MCLKKFSILVIIFALISFCTDKKEGYQKVEKKLFGVLDDGREVFLYILQNKNGMIVEIIDYGASIVSLQVPDRKGNLADVVLGYDKLEDYIADKSYFGAIVGRYGNRIGKGQFSLENTEYQLTINDGENHLHGGIKGFNKVLWTAEEVESSLGQAIKLKYRSRDGEQGYPGNVILAVTYTLTDENDLRIDFEGITDKPTILNPTNHTYFNLSGTFTKTILNHELKLNADSFTPVDQGLITTGDIVPVNDTPMDFKSPKQIGNRIDEDFEQLKFGRGYDHNWILNNYSGKLREVASLYEAESGRLMNVLTDQPGIQFYSGNFLDGTVIGKDGVAYQHRTGLCLETQHFPDSPNKPNFPSVELRPGETYKQGTIYQFSAE